jgi:phenylpropionate dioxygenase-like ring-hydroxylating dioxygenase large terminal subunit
MNAATNRGPALAPPPGGWQLLALASEITEQVSAVALGSRALVAVRDDGRVRVFDGTCPHRGASLGHGGRLAVTGNAGVPASIVCPFHGKRIGLGAGTGRLCVREHEVIDSGEALFVRLSDLPGRDLGFAGAMKGIAATHRLVAAVTGQAAVPPELIIENAFDFTHFPQVHLVPRVAKPKVWIGAGGELNIKTAFHTQAPDWEQAKGDFTSDFHARAFSPNLVVSELGSGASSRFVVTGAVPARGGCVVRIAVAVRQNELRETTGAIVEGSQIAFQQDLVIWNNMDLSAPERLDSSDRPVLAFRAFCGSFATRPAEPGNPQPAAAEPLAEAGRSSRLDTS